MTDSERPINTEDVVALKSGDADALRRVFFLFQPRLYRFLWLKTRSVEAAEDLVQETFLRLWAARRNLKPTTKLEIYLFRIASNLVRDELRKAERHGQVKVRIDVELAAADSSDDAIKYSQLARVVDQIVSTLPDAPKTAFLLSRYEELSHLEVSEVMGISVRTVEKHIGNALHVLKDGLRAFDITSSS